MNESIQDPEPVYPVGQHGGWVKNPAEVWRVCRLIEQGGQRAMFTDAAPTLLYSYTDDDKDVFFWQAEQKVLGKILGSWNQGQVGCHDEKTEVLTADGWVQWPNYNWSDPIATMNPLTHKLEYQTPTQKHVYDYNGPMYYADHRSLDFSLTPNHRMYVRKWDERNRTLSNNYQFCEIKDAGWYFGLPHSTSGFVGVDLKSLSIPDGREYSGDDFIALVALIVSDGFAADIASIRSNRVSFCCFNEKRRGQVEALAHRVGFREQPSRRGVWYSYDGALAEWLRANAYQLNPVKYNCHSKKIPTLIKTVCERQANLFLDFYGDKHTNSSGIRHYYSSNKAIIDDLQEMMMHIGKRGTICEGVAKSTVMLDGREIDASNCKTPYTLVERQKDRLSIDRAENIQVDRYKGQVFCATVPNSTIVTRRNGSILISGNSCVSFGFGRAVQDLMLWEIACGEAEQWPNAEVATEPIYAGSRVEVGGGGISGDGSIGAWAAKWIKDWGILLRQQYGEYDLRQYNEQRCRDWGYRGCPDALEPIARQHPVTAVAMARTVEEGWAAIGAGKPVPICSNQGFTTVLREGFCEPSGTWNHCMTLRARFTHPTRGKCFVIQNSWGGYLSGVNRIDTTQSGQVTLPEGCFATTWSVVDRILRQEDSFALAGLTGWARQRLTWNPLG